jgi:hypothetical protein
VLLDGDTLRAQGDAAQVGDVDIAIGAHSVVVSATHYKSATEQITISPGATLERSYVLEKGRGPKWYAAAAGAVAIVGGVVALLVGNGSSSAATATPLPSAPPPPSQ